MTLLNFHTKQKYRHAHFFIPPKMFNTLGKKAAIGGSAVGALANTGVFENDEERANTSILGRVGKIAGGAAIGGALGYTGAKAVQKSGFLDKAPSNTNKVKTKPQADRVNGNKIDVDEVSSVDGMVNTRTYDMKNPRDIMDYAQNKYSAYKNSLPSNPTPEQQAQLAKLRQNLIKAKSMPANLQRNKTNIVNFFNNYYLSKFYV
jgi:hypothetical protein